MRASTLLLALATAGCGTVQEPVLPDAWSAEPAEHPLTHADCVHLALRSAPSAAAWQARRLAAEAGLRAASRLPNPTLNASWEDFGIGGPALPVQQTFSLAMALEALLSRGRRADIATHALAAEVADLRVDMARVALAVNKDYDQLVAARARIELRRASRDVLAAQRAGLLRFVAAGIEPEIALARADAEIMQAEAELARAQADARLAEIALAFALGFARPVPLALAEPMTTDDGDTQASSAAEAAADDLEALLVGAAGARQELVAAQERYAAALERAHLQAARVRFLPTIAAGPRLESGEVRGVASLDVELPVFDGGGAGDAEQRAALLASAAELRRQAQQVAGEVALAAERRAIARRLFAHDRAPLAAARRALRERVERLFAAGEATFVEVIAARRDAIEAELDAVEAQLAVAAARLELNAALGTAIH